MAHQISGASGFYGATMGVAVVSTGLGKQRGTHLTIDAPGRVRSPTSTARAVPREAIARSIPHTM